MIGFNALGRMGRLGNQMFQYSALKGIAKNMNYQYCIPPSKNENEYMDHQLFIPFKMKNTTTLNIQYIDETRPVVVESDFSFDEKLFNSCPEWIDLRGFFQSEKYFKHIRNELMEDFEFKDEILEPAKETISIWKSPISLHIRRTDYITNPNHRLLELDYYEKALTHFDKNSDVIIFSDDPHWCMNQKLFDGDRFMISETMNSYIDLCLMTLCKGHIIANSSFSWWGAWLSNSEMTVAPSGWFDGSNNHYLDTKDLIPKNWTVIE